MTRGVEEQLATVQANVKVKIGLNELKTLYMCMKRAGESQQRMIAQLT